MIMITIIIEGQQKQHFLSPSVWPRREYIDTQLKGELTDLF